MVNWCAIHVHDMQQNLLLCMSCINSCHIDYLPCKRQQAVQEKEHDGRAKYIPSYHDNVL